MMRRCKALLWIVPYLYDVAVSMLDGSYYQEDTSPRADEIATNRDPHQWD